MKNTKTIEIKFKNMTYYLDYVAVYIPREKINAFSEEDVYSHRILCSESHAIANANVCRVLWQLTTKYKSLLGKGVRAEEDELFEYIRKDRRINEISQQKSGEGNPTVVIYYEIPSDEDNLVFTL